MGVPADGSTVGAAPLISSGWSRPHCRPACARSRAA